MAIYRRYIREGQKFRESRNQELSAIVAVDEKKQPAKRNLAEFKSARIPHDFHAKRRKMTGGVQIVSHQTHGIQSSYHFNCTKSKNSQNKSARDQLLEQAHREYQTGDYVSAEIHCRQVLFIPSLSSLKPLFRFTKLIRNLPLFSFSSAQFTFKNVFSTIPRIFRAKQSASIQPSQKLTVTWEMSTKSREMCSKL